MDESAADVDLGMAAELKGDLLVRPCALEFWDGEAYCLEVQELQRPGPLRKPAPDHASVDPSAAIERRPDLMHTGTHKGVEQGVVEPDHPTAVPRPCLFLEAGQFEHTGRGNILPTVLNKRALVRAPAVGPNACWRRHRFCEHRL